MKTLLCKAILFDLDGVLVNSQTSVEKHWRQWAHQHNLNSEVVLENIHGRRTIETIQQVAPFLSATLEAQRLDHIQASDPSSVVAIEGAIQLLSTLTLDQWAIVTSGSKEIALARLGEAGIPIPSVLISANDVVKGKPHPEGYLQAAQSLNRRPEECIVIEDAIPGIHAAHAAGMVAIAVATTHLASSLQEAEFCIPCLSAIKLLHKKCADIHDEFIEILLDI